MGDDEVLRSAACYYVDLVPSPGLSKKRAIVKLIGNSRRRVCNLIVSSARTAQETRTMCEVEWLQSTVSKFRNLNREFIAKVFELYYTSMPPILLSYKDYMYWNKCIFMINYLYIVGLGLFGLTTILYFII